MKYIAHFEPQAWIKDYAVKVDSEGEESWDCTDFINANIDLFGNIGLSDIDAEIDDTGSFMDGDDVLKGDDKAPRWIQDWQGPFTITVTREE